MSRLATICLVVLVLLEAFVILSHAQVLQRKVCPGVKKYKPSRLCSSPIHACTKDDECELGQRCCPQELECGFKCRKTVPPRGCPIPIDLAFVLDSSGSIGRRNWVKVKNFVKGIIDYYDVSEKGTHVGIIMYSNSASVQLRFDKYKGVDLNNVNIKRDIDDLILEKGLTFIDKGLILAENELFVEANGMRPERKKVALVITDGIQTKTKGPFVPLDEASAPLKAKGVSVYALGIGIDIDLDELLSIGSGSDYVFSATSFDELQAKVEGITKAQCQACGSRVDVVFGIPDSIALGPQEFKNIKDFFSRLSTLFQINAKTTHVGLIRYSDDADVILKLDEQYNAEGITRLIENLKLRGTGLNVKRALEVAADNAFTLFGGVRQTAPKTYVLFVPDGVKKQPSIQAAAAKVRGMGVRLVMMGITGKIDQSLSSLTSQPASRHFLSAVDYDALGVAAYEAADTACKAKYGKCQAIIPTPAECPAEKDHECDVDKDCNKVDEVCCSGGCARICQTRVKNCFVTMDVAIAIDTASDVNDEDLKQVKLFTTKFIHSLSDAENAARFGLMQYGEQAKTLTNFHQLASGAELKSMVDGLQKSSGTNRRVDVALKTMKSQLFSLEGGMRQGHPRYAIFLTSGATSPESEDLTKASKDLRKLGVNVIAVGIKGGVDSGFLGQLATEKKFVFSFTSSSELQTLWRNLKGQMCNPKPGSCPVAKQGSCTKKPEIGPNQIPCGESAGKTGRTAKENDWDCPGEQKCCLDPLGCLSICRHPSNVCRGQYDLALVIESTDKAGFKKVKEFAKQLVEAFTISQINTLVSIITYGSTAKVDLRFNTLTGNSLNAIKKSIDELPLVGGNAAGSGEALQLALDNVFTAGGGARKNSNKSLIVFSQGRFQDNAQAISIASKLRQKFVDVFAVPIGSNMDIITLSKVVNKPVEKDVFITTSFNALKPNLLALTKTICEGAEKIKVCKQPLDVVLGIPVSETLGPSFKKIKAIFKDILGILRINKMQVHVGVETYSDYAEFPLHIDSTYKRDNIINHIQKLQTKGNGLNLEDAFNVASHSAFSIFGGVRQTSPKVYIILVPGSPSGSAKSIRDAAENLRGLGVRVFLIGLEGMVDKALAKAVVSQPSQKYLYTAKSYNELAALAPQIVEAACKGRYAKCPHLPPLEASCPDVPTSECSFDKDCSTQSDMCCVDKCGSATCTKAVKNCFVTMDVAIAIDTASDVDDEDLKQVKLFTTKFIHSLSDAENAIRFGLMQYGEQAKTLTNFHQFASEAELKSMVDGLQKSSGTDRRVDVALKTMKSQLFSLEGGMRQGHPRYAIFLTSGATSPESEDLKKASKELRKLGVNVIAVGIKGGVDSGFLGQLATEKKFVFSFTSSSELQTLWTNLKGQMCNPKPGNCPASKTQCSRKPNVGRNQIPCGESAGKTGRAAKENDWDCPGEQKCCLDASGCLSICRHPPNFCRGRYDLALAIESTNAIGRKGFTKIKDFAKQLVDAFTISPEKTHVSLITFGASATGNLWFNSLSGSSLNKKGIKRAINGLEFAEDNAAPTSRALQLALDDVFTASGGSRENANKSLVIFSQGRFQDNAQAISIASKLRQMFVDVFAVPIGSNADVQTLSKVVNRPIEKNIFMTTSFNALKPNLRALTKTICEGALKIRICDQPLDVVLGIPVAQSLGPSLRSIEVVFNDIVALLKVNKMLVHVGVETYSNNAEFSSHIDSTYKRNNIMNFINELQFRGNGMNLEDAFNIASNRAFTIYGGVRQTSPKVFILLVPGRISDSAKNIRAAARKLKGLGVKVFVLGVDGMIDTPLAKAIASKPSQKYLYTANSYGELESIAYKVVDAMCRGRPGKCPPSNPPETSCSDVPPAECSFDKDCSTQSDMCCVDGCGFAKCAKAIKNCYVPSEIAFALDASETTTIEDFNNMKILVKKIIGPLASSENNLHLGIMTYASRPDIITQGFRNFRSEEELVGLVDSLTKTTETVTRVDLALHAAKREFFSPKGRMRHGHPKYLIFLTTSAQTNGDVEDVKTAGSDLIEAGVNILSVGMTSTVDGQLLQSLASDSTFVFSDATTGNLENVINDISAKLCHEKPGKCPAVSNSNPATCASEIAVPADLIPCGRSVGKEGQSNRENDWDCPGEAKCCQEPTNGCHSVCVPPPLVCNKKKDLLFLVEATGKIGWSGFRQIKSFIKQIINAFHISPTDTRVGFMSVNERSRVNFGFERGSLSKRKVREGIDRVRFSRGQSANIYKAFRTADELIFGDKEIRETINKSVVLFTSGTFKKPYEASKAAFRLREHQVDVFAVSVGQNPEVEYIENIVSRKTDKNIFMISSYGALKPQLRAIVDTICEGAIKEVSLAFSSLFKR